MASVDSGVDTENESNDSSLTTEPVRNDTTQQTAGKQQASTQTENDHKPMLFTILDRPVFVAESVDWGGSSLLFSEETSYQLNRNKEYNYPDMFHRNKIQNSLRRIHYSRVHAISKITQINAEKKLRMAANFNNIDAVRRLLNDGVNPRAVDKKKRTALHISACKGYADIVSLLLANGADPLQKDIVGNTALHVAAYTNHFKVILQLLQAAVSNLHALDESSCNVYRVIQMRMRSLLKDSNSLGSDQPPKVLEEALKLLEIILKHCNDKAEAELIVGFSTNLTFKHVSHDDDNIIQDALYSLSELTLQKRT